MYHRILTDGRLGYTDESIIAAATQDEFSEDVLPSSPAECIIPKGKARALWKAATANAANADLGVAL